MRQVAELLRWKDFLAQITSADYFVGLHAKKKVPSVKKRLVTAKVQDCPPPEGTMATVNEAEFDQSVSILRNSFTQYPGSFFCSLKACYSVLKTAF